MTRREGTRMRTGPGEGGLRGLRGSCTGVRAIAMAGSLIAVVASTASAAAQPASPRVAVGPNLRVGVGEHNEVWVAVSATDPDFLIAVGQTGGGVDIGTARHASTFVSRDGGRRWTPVALPGYTSGAFDPMVIAGPDGRMYVMQQIIGGAFASLIGSDADVKPAIRVWSTTDGWSWKGPTELNPSVPPDHARMAVDVSDGPHHGRLYIAWNDVADQFVRDHYEVFVQWTDDGGATFTDPWLVDQREGGKLVATEPVVLSDGTLLVTWYQYWNPLADARNDSLPFFVRRSRDGGATWSETRQIFDFGPHVWRSRMGEFARAFSLPIVMADTSRRSAHRDNVYIVWDDVRSGYSDIWLVRSTDRGATWSAPRRVNDNERGAPLGVADYRMTPTVAIAPDGTVGVAWYDRRNDPVRRCWELFFAASTDGGATFGPNVPVSNAKSCPPADLAPGIVVHNLGPRRDLERPPDSLLARMSLIERIGYLSRDALAAARAQAAGPLDNGRLQVSFDASRNVWPGHYSGLAADGSGVFHALWLDRRNGAQELFATRVTVGTPPPDRSGLRETDVTAAVEVLAGTPVYDAAQGTVRIPVQVRNTSDGPIHGPLELRITSVAGTPAGASAEIAGDNPSRVLRFEGRLGSDDVLPPLGVTEPVPLTLRVAEATGLDAALEFRVFGRRR